MSVNTCVFFDLLEINHQYNGEKIAVVNGDVEYSYSELYFLSIELSIWLKKMGIFKGDRIAVHFNKGIREIIALFAISKIGAIFVNINSQWKDAQICHVFNDCNFKVLITCPEKATQLINSSNDQIAFSLLSLKKGSQPGNILDHTVHRSRSVKYSNCGIKPNIAALIYTSGSTGKPKGVMVTHDNLIQGARIVSSYLNNTSKDILLSVLPLSFDYGLNQLTSIFLVGGTLVLQRAIMPSTIVENINSKRITGLAAVPTIWVNIMNYLDEAQTKLPSLRYITNSGGRIPDRFLMKMSVMFQNIDIFLMYGFTEAFRSTYLHPTLFDEKRGSLGKAVPGEKIFILNAEGEVAQDDTIGELVHCGSLVSAGYWGKKDGEEKIQTHCSALPQFAREMPMAFSGDLVRRDTEGFLWFVGRKSEMIKVSGHRVSPNEIEEYLMEAGCVDEVIAFGMQGSDYDQTIGVILGQLPCDFSEDLFIANCRKIMPSYMVPKKIFFWQKRFPLLGNGKTDRNKILKQVIMSARGSGNVL